MRLATFELKNRGYNIEAVDAAMNRLEAAFVKRDRADAVAAEGEAAGTTASQIARRPCTRACSARVASVSRTLRAVAATTAMRLMTCSIASLPTLTRPGT